YNGTVRRRENTHIKSLWVYELKCIMFGQHKILTGKRRPVKMQVNFLCWVLVNVLAKFFFHLDMQTDFFEDFPLKGGHMSFPVFNFASGKLPETRAAHAWTPTENQNLTLSIEDCGHNMNTILLILTQTKSPSKRSRLKYIKKFVTKYRLFCY